MSIVRVNITLSEEEYEALFNLAEVELRYLPAQAKHIIRRNLKNLGLIRKPESQAASLIPQMKETHNELHQLDQ